MFGRYSLDYGGLIYAGGNWDTNKYSTYLPDQDNCIPITDEPYFEDDIVGRFIDFIRIVYGAETLEENLDFIAKALGNKGGTNREIMVSASIPCRLQKPGEKFTAHVCRYTEVKTVH